MVISWKGVIPMVSSSAVITIDRCPQSHDSAPLMLQPLLFAPAAVWLVRALQNAGVERFLILTRSDLAEQAAACFPEGSQLCLLDAADADEAVRAFAAKEEGEVIAVNAPVWICSEAAEMLCNDDPIPTDPSADTGIGRLHAAKLAKNGGVKMLGQIKPLAAEDEDGLPLALPLRDAFDLMQAQELARTDLNARLVEDGVRLLDPGTTYIDPTVTVGAGTVLLPNVILRGDTHIGANCEIGPNTMIRDCTLGDGCVANSSQLNEAVFGANVNIGPFAYVRPGTRVADNAKVGDFVEVKNAVIGEGTKLPHLIYVGDSDVGQRVNFGCGTVTTNYDGHKKHRCTIGDDVFLGCNTNLIAPVTVADRAYTAAGSTVTDDVPEGALAIARQRQTNIRGWADRLRKTWKK